MAGELGRDWSLPLLPSGFALFDSLPVGALVLDALAPVIGNGMITMNDGESEGALVVRNGVVTERVWVANGVRSHGDEALALIRSAGTAMVSARRLGDEAMVLLGPLLHGNPCYDDLRLEWIVWSQFLTDLCGRGRTFVLEVSTPSDRGVTCVRGGRQVATFTESHPAPGDASLLDDIAAGGVGSVRVLVDGGGFDAVDSALAPSVANEANLEPASSVASETALRERIESYIVPGDRSDRIESYVLPSVRSDRVEPYVLPAVRSEHVESDARPAVRSEHAEPYLLPPARLEPAPPAPARPVIESTGDPNVTFSAIFGPHLDTSDAHQFLPRNDTRRGAEQEVASVLPQLRLLVQHRLQRSSGSVEEIVESAATDHQNVAWLSDRVRVMTMRGFLHSTFDQLADDMLALAGREPA
jgi:hypothetical protein